MGVINFKFQTYARRLLLEDLFHYLILLISFTSCCNYTGYNRRFFDTNGSIASLILVVSVGTGNLIRLFKQFHTLWMERQYTGISYYMTDYMKWIEFSSYIVVVAFLPLASIWRHGEESHLVIGFMATASVLLWVKLLYYAQAFKSTGPMVIMILEIVKDIRRFLFFLVAFLVSFDMAFFILLADMDTSEYSLHPIGPDLSSSSAASMPALSTEDNGELEESVISSQSGYGEFEDFALPSRSDDGFNYNSSFCAYNVQAKMLKAVNSSLHEKRSLGFRNPIASLLMVFRVMLSDIGDIMDTIYNSDIEEGTQVLALTMMFIFLAAVAVLLNLMIAIMGDSFNRVKNHGKALFLKKRAAVIQDMEMGLSQKRKKEIKCVSYDACQVSCVYCLVIRSIPIFIFWYQISNRNWKRQTGKDASSISR